MAKEVKSASAKKNEDWMNNKWRPMMGWTYMLTCLADFVIFPVLWSVAQAMGNGQVNVQWQPITLQGAGLFHIAMGAILGIAVYGRTKEKLEGANNGGMQLQASTGTTYIPPSAVGQQFSGNTGTPMFVQPQSMESRFGDNSTFDADQDRFDAPAATVTSRSGKPGPAQNFPEL